MRAGLVADVEDVDPVAGLGVLVVEQPPGAIGMLML